MSVRKLWYPDIRSPWAGKIWPSVNQPNNI